MTQQPPMPGEAGVSEGRKAYIVWNEARNEGVIFCDDGSDTGPFATSAKTDARQARTGRSGVVGSSLAEAFYQFYEDDDERPLQVVDLAALQTLGADQ